MKHHVREGEPVSRVSERFGVSRQTVYNHLKREGKAEKERNPRASKLDPFKVAINARLAEFDLPASTLFREIKEQGYTGGITILRDYVRQVKGERVREITERFETLPGKQAQLDWGECGVILEDGQRKKLYVFTLVLGYSRMLFARFTTSTKQPVLLGLLKEAFEQLGVPKELLIDNMKQAVEHHNTKDVDFNKTFLDFCEHYGVLPVAAPPYWPRVKGKVERGVGYVKGSFLLGRLFTDLRDLNGQLDHWLDTVANVRVHGTTGERPIDRYPREQGALRAAAAVPAYDTRPVEVRKVARDCHVRYRGVAYSVPPVAVGKTVTIRASSERAGARFEVCLGSELLAVHAVAPPGERWVTLNQHAEAIRKLSRAKQPQPASKRPRYRQIATPFEQGIASPVVQVRSLASYQQLLEETP